MRAALIYPHQLFPEHPALSGADVCVLVEEPLLLTQYRFHRQKLILHRASMQHFADRLRRQKRQVRYVECGELDSTGDIAGVVRNSARRMCSLWTLATTGCSSG
jgi:deoxyribodipyrimidine photolyase-related protein